MRFFYGDVDHFAIRLFSRGNPFVSVAGSPGLQCLDEVAEFPGDLFLRLHGPGDFLADGLAEFLPHAVDGDFERPRSVR